MNVILSNFFKSLAPFTEEELNKASKYLKPVDLKKNEFFSKAGKVSERIGFVTSGVLRSFYTINDKETTTFFQVPGSVAAALQSFLQEKPAIENIQALVNSELLTMHRRDLYLLYEEDWKWQQVGRVLMEEYYLHMEQRIISLQSQSAQERYSHFADNYPELLISVPLQHIASYLGISPETLSRIRSAI